MTKSSDGLARGIWRVIAAGALVMLSACVARERSGGTSPPTFHAGFLRECVAADHPLASEAGSEVLAKGGNAVDAAVATAFALSVVRPESCGIGGGGFMVIHLESHPRFAGALPIDTAIDFRERAPAAAAPDMFERTDILMASQQSGLAVAIPGTVAGLLSALDKYGTLDRATVLAPAIRLAREGWRADATTVKGVEEGGVWSFKVNRGGISTTGNEVEPSADQAPPPDLSPGMEMRIRLYGGARAGDLIVNEGHARALELIAEHGRDGFYRGAVAEAMVRSVSIARGVLTYADLEGFRAKEVAPLRGRYLGRTLLTMPLPSSGGVTMLQTLGILRGRDVAERPTNVNEVTRLHVLTECFKLAFVDRAVFLGDPEFGNDPTHDLLRPDRMKHKSLFIVDGQARPVHTFYFGLRVDEGSPAMDLEADGGGGAAVAALLPDDHGTSHLSVVDRWGNAVACTTTINLEYGSKVGVPEFGFFLNNEMDDFLTKRGQANAFGLEQSERNLPEPGKRPLSSMSPTIVLGEDGRVEMVVGGSGGPRIITGTVQAMLNVMLHGMSAGDAVASPRIHHQWMPDVLRVEFGAKSPPSASNRIADSTIVSLIEKGHHVTPMENSSAIQLIVRRGGGWDAACDPRKGGRPAGH